MIDEIGKLFNIYIPKGQLDLVWDALDKQGKLEGANKNAILLLVIKHIEKLENDLTKSAK